MPRFPKREPVAVPACVACGAFTPDVLVPDGNAVIGMCWCCAHAHVDHGVALGRCAVHECECLPEAVYPERVLLERRKSS